MGKKNVLVLAMLTALMSGSALAASGENNSSDATLNFSGKVTSSLCQVNTSDLTKNISLGEISATALQASGKAPAQSFNVVLNNCDTSTGKISYVFADSNGSSPNAAYLEPTSGDATASGVGVFLEQSNGTKINIGQAVELDTIKGADGNSALPQQTIPLKAYIGKKTNNGQTTAGSVNATAIMTIRAAAAPAVGG
ncbi:TPA: fimbrial protein [Klebsiella oxytoca]